ncbi:MAG: biotin--[acetyl-CoA-carboxylase] ligase [Gammaproteobacteria bacterium]|nr:biotin--[acetyl-CoA-carboxylase] ligase [Gammaproteobacteria bacterium]
MLPSKKIVEHLHADSIKTAIDPLNLSALAALDIFESINSTNSYLLERAKSGAATGTVCLAQMQTEGRGRHGRVWNSESRANLYLSMLWHFPAQQSDLSSLSLAVAVVVASVLKKYGVTYGVELKWPNDVLFSGRKLAGILLETLSAQNGQIPVVIGIGINILLPSEINEPAWIDLNEIMGKLGSCNYLAGLLINELLERLPHYKNRGLLPFLEEWQAYDYLKNKSVTIHDGEQVNEGVVLGITSEGELLLKRPSGEIEKFRCGEVSVRIL